jgi:cellobiose phosphorylase
VRPSRNELVLRPRLLNGLNNVKATIILRGQTIDITLGRAEKEPVAIVNGKQVPMVNRELRLPLPRRALNIEMKV